MKYLILSLVLFALSNSVMASEEESIQGKQFRDRTNGIYELSIKNSDVTKFLQALQAAEETNNAKAFACLISYPCRWYRCSQLTLLKDELDFLKHQQDILTPEVKERI